MVTVEYPFIILRTLNLYKTVGIKVIVFRSASSVSSGSLSGVQVIR